MCVYVITKFMGTGGRVAEGAGLLNQYAGNRIEGSNPSPSANSLHDIARFSSNEPGRYRIAKNGRQHRLLPTTYP